MSGFKRILIFNRNARVSRNNPNFTNVIDRFSEKENV